MFFLATWGSTLGAAALVVTRRLPGLTGTMRVLAFAVVATAGLIAVHVLPAACYLLSREAVLITALLALLVASRLPRAHQQPASFPNPGASSRRVSWALAAWTTVGLALWIGANAWRLRYHPPDGIDTLSFHLPSVARWVQTGTLWQIDELLPDLFFGNYPNNGDVVLLASVLPFKNDFLTHFAILPFLPFTTLSVYCLGRELRATAPVALSLAAMLTAIPLVVQPAIEYALPDAILFATFAAGLAFLARRHRTGATSDLVLAGVALGVAFGTKWYGVTGVVLTVAVWSVARFLNTRNLSTAVRESSVLIGLVAAGGGIWLARNLLLSGNPLFPQKIAPLGITIFDAPPDQLRDIVGATVFSYFDDPHVWREYLLHGYRISAALPGLVLALGSVAATALIAWHRRSARRDAYDGVVVTVLALVAVLAGVYVVTPYSALGPRGMPILVGANVRYVIPALIAAAGVTGWVVGRLGPRVCVVVQLVALGAAIDGLRISGVGGHQVVYVCFVVAAVVVGVGWLATRHWVDWRSRVWRPGRRAAIAGVAIVLIAALGGGNHYQRNFNTGRYVGFDPVLDWVAAKAPTDRKIGLAGVWTDRGLAPIYPVFGPRLGNQVVYNGPFVRELLTRYRRPAPFLAMARRQQYDLMLIGRGPTFEQGEAGERRQVIPEVKEERWVRSVGYREIVRSDRFVLFRAPPHGTR